MVATMETLVLVLLVLAVIVFVVAAVSKRTWPVGLVALGLALTAAALVVERL